MQILLVTVIMAVLATLISDLERLEVFSVGFRFKQIRSAELDSQMRSALRVIRQAYDQGLSGTCPAQTSPRNNLPNMCWSQNSLNNNNCFTHNLKPNAIPLICLHGTQTASNKTVAAGTYNQIEATNSAFHGQANRNKASVYVSAPGADGGNVVRSNTIRCSANNTRCFTIVLCSNGLPNCPVSNQIIQTFAVRAY